MYSRFQILIKYLQFWLDASSSKGHGIHSPFVFDFIKNVLNDKTSYPDYELVESLRSQLLKDLSIINVEDMGAGSSLAGKKQRTIATIAKNSAKTKKFGQLLFRMIKYYQPVNIIELGTSLGITTSYLALANPKAKLISLEGASEVAKIAKKNFRDLDLHNIEMVEGNFDETLASIVCGLSSVDFAFIDGNHRKEPTERYFHELLSYINYDSILVFDDIHWSREMEAAWEHIKNHSSVACSFDLFFIGIIFFRKEFKEKQEFKIRF